MKNYQCVFGLLFSSVLSYSAHAGTGFPQADAAPDEDVLSARATKHATGAAPPMLAQARPMPTADKLAGVAATTPTIDLRSDKLVSRANLPTTFNYADSNADAGPAMLTEPNMAAHAAVAEDLTEPASEVLLLAGLSALAIGIRRQSKS